MVRGHVCVNCLNHFGHVELIQRNALGTTGSVAGAHRARFRAHVNKVRISCLFACACDLLLAVTLVFPIRKLILDPTLKRSPSS